MSVVRQELSLMERALLDDREDQFFVLYQELRRKMAAIRIQASWRRKIKVRRGATTTGGSEGGVGQSVSCRTWLGSGSWLAPRGTMLTTSTVSFC